MRQITYVVTLVISSVFLGSWTTTAVPNSGIKPFGQPSLLANVTVTSDRAQAGSNTHLFTMTMPERSGNRFTKLSFSFTEQDQAKTVAPLRFNLASTKAMIGSVNAEGQAIAIKDVWIDETGVLWVEFESPIPPKTQITLALQTLKTSPAATYDYGIAAYPEAKSSAIFVGDGSLIIRQ
jgi:Protein of unknown function (DUF2808)